MKNKIHSPYAIMKFYVSFGTLVYVTMQESLKNLIQACSALSNQQYHFFLRKINLTIIDSLIFPVEN